MNKKIKSSVTGYKSNSKDRNEKSLLINSGRITMKDVPHPVYGVDDMGNEMMMYPGNEYIFPGNFVTEYPIRQQGGQIPNPYYEQQLGLYNSFNNPSIYTDVNEYQVLEGDALDKWYTDQTRKNPSLTQDNGAFVGGYKPSKVYLNSKNDSFYQTYGKPSRTIPQTSTTSTPLVNATVPVEAKAAAPKVDPNGWRTASVITLKKQDGGLENVYVPFGSKYPKTGYSYEKFIEENGELGDYNRVPDNVKNTASGSFKNVTTEVPFPEEYGQNSQYMQYARKLREIKLKEIQQKATTTSMAYGGECNAWDPQFYQDKQQNFMEWVKNTAAKNTETPDTYMKQVGGIVNSRAYNVGRVYTSPYDQPISPDIYGDEQFDNINTNIMGTNYGRNQATIDYSTTASKTQNLGPTDLSTNQGNQVPGSYNTSSVNWNYSPSPPQVENPSQPMTIDPNVEPIQSTERIYSDVDRAVFDRNKPLERDLKKQQRDVRRNSVSGQTKANILLSGFNFLNNLAGQDEQSRYEEQLQKQYATENLYSPVTGYRGDYLLNAQGANFRPNDYSFGNFGKVYREGGEYRAGGEYEMTEEELQDFIANGGEVEFLD